jgi:hypothetical protein
MGRPTKKKKLEEAAAAAAPQKVAQLPTPQSPPSQQSTNSNVSTKISSPISHSSANVTLPSPLDNDTLINLLRKQKQKEPPDPRFSSGTFSIEGIPGLKTSLVINLRPNGFTLDNQGVVHPYDRNTRELLLAIDQNRLLPDLIELLDEAGQTHYYDGCVVVELKDHRHTANGNAHTTRKVLLAPSMESLVYDIDVLGKSLDGGSIAKSPDDLIALEQRILHATAAPLCLDPSPSVFFTEHNKYFNAMKFNRRVLKGRVSANNALGGLPNVAESYNEPFNKRILNAALTPATFALAKYLQSRAWHQGTQPNLPAPQPHYPYHYMYPSSPRPPPNSSLAVNIGGVVLPATVAQPVSPVVPNRPNSIPPLSKPSPQADLVANRVIKFHSASGFVVYTYEISPNASGVGYECSVRIGDSLDDSNAHHSSPPYILRCSRPSLSDALSYVAALRHLFERDGAYMLAHDSLLPTHQQQSLISKTNQLRHNLEVHFQQQKSLQQMRYNQLFQQHQQQQNQQNQQHQPVPGQTVHVVQAPGQVVLNSSTGLPIAHTQIPFVTQQQQQQYAAGVLGGSTASLQAQGAQAVQGNFIRTPNLSSSSGAFPIIVNAPPGVVPPSIVVTQSPLLSSRSMQTIPHPNNTTNTDQGTTTFSYAQPPSAPNTTQRGGPPK